MPYPNYTPDEPWMLRMTHEELRKNLAKTANRCNRYRARMEKAEASLIRARQALHILRTIFEPQPDLRSRELHGS